MTAAVISVTRPSDVRGFSMGNKRCRFFDITADTGTYTTGGFTILPSAFGMKHVDFVMVGSAATSGTAGATALVIGVTYVSGGTSILFQPYEAAASGAPMLEKTSAEAYPTNTTFRVMVIGN